MSATIPQANQLERFSCYYWTLFNDLCNHVNYNVAVNDVNGGVYRYDVAF